MRIRKARAAGLVATLAVIAAIIDWAGPSNSTVLVLGAIASVAAGMLWNAVQHDPAR